MAIVKPMENKVIGSELVIPTAAVDAISKLEGPAKGMRFSPKAVRKRIISSIINICDRCLLLKR